MSIYQHLREGMQLAELSNRRIPRNFIWSDIIIRQCWQEWMNCVRALSPERSSRPKETTDCADRAIVRQVIMALSWLK